MSDETEYELMVILKTAASYSRPDGIDSEPAMLGDARGVIRYLLKRDSSVKDYKLVKRQKRGR